MPCIQVIKEGGSTPFLESSVTGDDSTAQHRLVCSDSEDTSAAAEMRASTGTS